MSSGGGGRPQAEATERSAEMAVLSGSFMWILGLITKVEAMVVSQSTLTFLSPIIPLLIDKTRLFLDKVRKQTPQSTVPSSQSQIFLLTCSMSTGHAIHLPVTQFLL